MSNFNTDKIPEFNADKQNGLFEISGRSYPENVAEVYEPFLTTLKDYIENPLPKTTFNIRLEMCNTGTTKMLIYIFHMLDNMIREKDVESVINWYIMHDDEDDLQLADDMKRDVESEFNVYVSF